MSADTLDLGPVEVDEFREFWKLWPRHKDTARAEAAYWRARRIASAEEILTAAREYAATVAGKPADQCRWAVEWLRAEPWRPATTTSPTPAASPARRRRRRPGPRRAPHITAPVRLTEAEKRAQWLRVHGVTEEEFEAKKGDQEWLEKVKRRGRMV